MKSVFLLMSGALALVISGCAQRTRPADEVRVYTFATQREVEPAESKRMIEKYLAAKDVGDIEKSGDGAVRYVSKENVSETFEQDIGNGNFTFNKSMRKYTGAFVPKLPGPQQSIRQAQEFLDRNDIAPRNRGQLRMVHLGGLRASSVIDGKRAGPIVDELVTVNFGRVVDGITVIGPGSKIVVNVGDGGEIMGAIHRWRELNDAKGVPVRPEERFSPQEAEEMARRQIIDEFGEGASYRVLASGKRYFDNNGKILQPVYAFEVTVALKDRKIQPFDYLCVIPMLRNSPEPLALTAIDPKARSLIGNPPRGQRGVSSDRPSSD